MNAPSGMEMLIKNVLKMLGIKAEDILGPLTQIRDTINGANERLERIETAQQQMLQHLQQQDYINGPDRTERPNESDQC